MSKKQIFYSDKYTDDEFEYRHVVLPKQLSKLVPSSHLMAEDEWRGLGVQQSQGWVHYMIHKPAQEYSKQRNMKPVQILRATHTAFQKASPKGLKGNCL